MAAAVLDRAPYDAQLHSELTARRKAGSVVEEEEDSAKQIGADHAGQSSSKADWRPTELPGSSNAIQPEIAVLLHYIIDEPSDMTAKVCAIQMLIEARQSSVGNEESASAHSATYYDLLLGAASACSAIVSTPKALGGNEVYATLWRSALCGLIPSIIVRLEQIRTNTEQERTSSQSGSRISSIDLVTDVVSRLFDRAAQTLEQCGVAFTSRATGQDKTDEDSVMLDALIDDDSESTTRRPFGAIFLRSLADKGLVAPLHQGAFAWPDAVATVAAESTMGSTSLNEAKHASLTLETLLEQKLASGGAEQISFLDRFRDDYAAQAPLSDALLKSYKEWVLAADLEALSRACSALLEHDVALYVWLMHVSPTSVMDALSPLLDNADNLQSGEDPSVLGAIVLFGQMVVQLAVGAGATYDQVLARQPHRLFSSILRASAATKTLGRSTGRDQEIVGAWITSLFGSDGISDDLTRSSPPHLLLRVTPTIFAQIVTAAAADLVDGETLRGGLTYFLQDLLSYTLPGAVRSLLHDIERCHFTQLPSTLSPSDRTLLERRKGVCVTVLCGLLRAENCPKTVKKLVAVHVVSCLDRCKPFSSDEAELLLNDLTPIANAQQEIRRTDLWIKTTAFVAATISSSSRTTAVSPGATDALLNLNASLYSIAAQRGPSAVSRLVGNVLRADTSASSVFLQRSVACSIGVIALREHLDDPVCQIDLSQSAVVRLAYDLIATRQPYPIAAVRSVLQLVRQLVVALSADGMVKHMHLHQHHPEGSGPTLTDRAEVTRQALAEVLTAIEGLIAAMRTP